MHFRQVRTEKGTRSESLRLAGPVQNKYKILLRRVVMKKIFGLVMIGILLPTALVLAEGQQEVAE